MQICANFVQMEVGYSISIYLDTRRQKADGTFPVKLRVYSTILGKTKFYPTTFNLTESDFSEVWEKTRPKKEYRETNLEIKSIEKRADDIAKELKIFSFEQFEKRWNRATGSKEDIFYHFTEALENLRSNNQFGTASNYQLSLKSLKDFIEFKTGYQPEKLLFAEISQDWLQKYENYMVNDLGRSFTTVSMYLRALRTVFNTAIRMGELSADFYPFGSEKYVIPSVEGIKKALDKVQLKALFEGQPATVEQERAKDFWFFSYACNGMNIKDIAQLRWKDFEGDKLVFLRAKTIKSTKSKMKKIEVFLNDYSKMVVEKYGSKNRNPNELIFPIINLNDSKEKQHLTVKNFTRSLNQNFIKYSKSLGLTEKISSYWARHSFATSAIRNGESMEFVSEALGHSDTKVTQIYIKGFDEKTKQEFADKLMNF